MNREVLTPAVQRFLLEKTNADPRKIALAKSPFEKVSSSELATQIESRQKAKKKLPLWFNSDSIYYPPTISIEQASSETTALYKSKLIPENGTVIDLTGGFGVDAFYFSLRSKSVFHCEINTQLSEIASHNAKQLGKGNIHFINGNGIDYLLSNDSFYNTIFVDPSRRVNTRKVFKLDDCEPNIIQYQDELLKKSNQVLIKTSPLLDISLSISQLNHVKEIHIISLKNECKELLFILEKAFIGQPIIHAILLSDNKEFKFSFSDSEEKEATFIIGEPMHYLYDPDVAILKAGCFKLLAQRYSLKKLNLNTHLYTSNERIENFPGRVFNVKEVLEYKDFKKAKKGLSANVIAKNFPLNVESLRKKHKIEESEKDFIFFCKTNNDKLSVILAERD
jgi:precorrin-6B methylase 2